MNRLFKLILLLFAGVLLQTACDPLGGRVEVTCDAEHFSCDRIEGKVYLQFPPPIAEVSISTPGALSTKDVDKGSNRVLSNKYVLVQGTASSKRHRLPTDINAVVATKIGTIYASYFELRKTIPGLAGTLTVGFSVTAHGGIENVRIAKNDGVEKAFADQVVSVFKTFSFNPVNNGSADVFFMLEFPPDTAEIKRIDRSRFDIFHEISSLSADLKATYEEALSTKPQLAGAIVMEITITESGSVTGVLVLENETNDKAFAEKIIALVKELDFGKDYVNEARAEYTFDFSAEVISQGGKRRQYSHVYELLSGIGDEITPIYDAMLRNNPQLRGDMKISMDIARNGMPTAVEVVKNGLDAPTLTTKLLSRVKELRFGSAKKGDVHISYSYSFDVLNTGLGGENRELADISEVIIAILPEIKSEYRSRLRKDGELAGQIVVRLTIAADGSVTSTELVDDAVGDEELADLVVDMFQDLQFAATTKTGKTVVKVPVRFHLRD